MSEQEQNGPIVSGAENQRRKRSVIYLMTFIMGGCGIAYEYTFSKLSSDLMGNSVQQWAITIGLMMFFMGVGSDVQKHLKDEGLFDKFIFFEVLLGLIGGFGPILLLYIFGANREHYVLVQYGLIVSTGFLIGLEIPILARINERFTPELRVNIGGILRMDYIGAFFGAFLWVFILHRFFGLTQMGFALGALNMITAALSLFYFFRLARRRAALTALTLFGSAMMFAGLYQAPAWTAFAEQRLFVDRVIHASTTKYQHIVLTQSASGDLYCYINGNTQFSSVDEHIYHEFLVHPAMALAERRQRVLILGGGDGLAMREVLKYPDVETATLVDLDPGVTDLARENPYLRALNEDSLGDARVKILENNGLVEPGGQETVRLPDQTLLFAGEGVPVAEVEIVNIDAALFIEQISGVYDVIIIDFPDPSNLELSKLYSRGFYEKVREKLSRHGVMIQQSTSPTHSKEAFLCIGRTMEAAGFAAVPMREYVPSFGEWGWWVAMRREAAPAEELARRLSQIRMTATPVRYITDELVAASLVFGKGALASKRDDVNTILNNVIYFYYADALAASE